ncbi:MAG: AI-2E family transporter [Pseudomonadota bacterium]
MQANDRFRNFVFGVALALMLGWILYIGQNIFIPVIASIILAYIIIAVAQWLGQIPAIGERLPAVLRYTFSILAIIGIVTAFVSLIISNINQVIELAPVYQARLLAVIQNFAGMIGQVFEIDTEPTWETVRRDILGEISLQSIVGSTVTSISVLVGSVFVVMVYTGFAMAERRLFERKMMQLSDRPDDGRRIADIVRVINTRIGDYLAAKTLVNLVLGLISYIVMAIVGLDFAAFWAVLIALFNYVPYVGSFLGVLFPSTIAVIQFGDPTLYVGTFIGLVAAQVFMGSIVEPNFLGRSLNLSPFIILVSLTSWGSLWGIAGALLSVPITAIMVIILSEFEGTRPIAVLLSRSGQIPPKRHQDGTLTIDVSNDDL